MKKSIWLIQAALFYLFTLVIAYLPRYLSKRIGKKIGGLLFNVIRSRRSIAIENIRQALPFMKRHPAWSSPLETPEEIAHETFLHLGMSIVEICLLYHGKGDATIDAIEVRGLENFERARAKHKGLILIGGHCGNWELMALASKKVYRESISVIVRRQNNPYLNTLVDQMRMHYSNQMIYKVGALRPILNVIKNDGLIGMLADQAVFADDGILIDVLGRKAWANKAPAIIAHKTGVPLVPMFIHREDNHHVLTIHPEYELRGDRTEEGIQLDIQALSRYLEDFVCAHPADCYGVHRRWKRAGEMVDAA